MSDAEALGQRLREAREAKDLTLDDVERSIRIRARFVEALERGDYNVMTPVQAQGFLRNYARFLGLDFELLLSELEGEKGRSRRKRRGQQVPTPASQEPPQPATTTTATRSATVRRIVTPVEAPRPAPASRQRTRKPRTLAGNISIVLIAGAIVVGLVFGATLLFNQLTDSPDENPPQAELISSPTTPADTAPANETVSPSPVEVTAALTPVGGYTPPALTGTSVVVSIQVLQRTWLRVTVDGTVEREGLARPGEVWQFEGALSVGVRANNAAALELTVNNQPQGTLGARGQLFDYTYSLSGGAVVPNTASTAGDVSGETPSAAPTEVVFQPPNFTPIASPEPATFTPTPPAVVVTVPLSDGIPSNIPGQASGGITASPAAGEAANIISGATSIALPLSETDTPTPSPTVATATEPSSAPTLIRSPTPTLSPTITPTPSDTLTPTSTPSLTRTPSLTPTPTFTFTPSPTLTLTPTMTPSQTPFLPPRYTRTPTSPPK